MTDLLLLPVLSLCAIGYGAGVARLLSLRFTSRLEALSVDAGLGAGLLALLVLALGVTAELHFVAALVLVVPGALGGAFVVWRTRKTPAPAPHTEPRWLRVALWAVLAIAIAANLVGAAAPPTFIDALYYHLFAPAQHVREGRIAELPWIWQTYQPVAVEMLFTLGITLSSLKLAALCHAALGVLAAAATGLLGRRLAGPRGGLFAAAVFYTTAMVAWESTSAFVELGVAAFGALSLYALLRFDEGGGRGWLVAAGVLGGFAASCKLPGALLPLLSGGVLVYLSLLRKRGAGATLRALIVFGVVALVTVSPWYVRTYLMTGNPVYPFLPQLFGENVHHGMLWETLSRYGPGRAPLDFVLAPWRLVTSGDSFERGQYLGVLPLLLAPVIAWRARKAGERQALFLLALVSFLAWLSGAHVARYLVVFQPFAAALAADALVCLLDADRLRRAAAILAVVPALGFGVATTLAYDAQFAKVVFGRVSEEQFLREKAWFHDVFRTVTKELPADARLLTSLGGTLYLERQHFGMHRRDFAEGPAALRKRVEHGRFTHMLIEADQGKELVAAFGPRARMLWERKVSVTASRTFGGTIDLAAALWEIRER